MDCLFRANFGRDLFRLSKGRRAGAKNECGAMLSNAGTVIRPHLGQDEQLLWSAQPKGGIAFRIEDLYLIPFSLMWCGFAIFWEWGVSHSSAPLFFRLWGIPFVTIGLYMIFGRFIFDAWLRSNTYYGLTTERAMIVRRTLGESVQSIELKTLGDVALSVGNDRSGMITFGNDTPGFAWFGMSPWRRGYVMAPRFERIERAGEVYAQVRDAQGAAQDS
jgi:hypothetical protein